MNKKEIKIELNSLNSVLRVEEDQGSCRVFLDSKKLALDRDSLYEVGAFLRSKQISTILNENVPCWDFVV